MPRWTPWAVLLGACGLLALYTLRMEARVDAVRGKLEGLEAQARTAAPEQAPAREQTQAPPGSRRGQPGEAEPPAATAAPRALDEQLAALRADLDSLERATREMPTRDRLDSAASESKILSTVERRNAEIRERQLQFHRQKWLDARQEAVRLFAKAVELQPDAHAALDRLLGMEVDVMVDLLRDPKVLADPRSAADDWAETLAETDRAASEVLTPKQHKAWRRVRAQERQVLWPWLDEAVTPPLAPEDTPPP